MAGTTTVGDLEYRLSVQTSDLIQARRDIEDLRRQVIDMSSTSRNVQTLETSFTALAGAIAGIVSAGGLTAFITQVSQAVSEQKIFADSIGTSYEQLQRLQYVAGQVGVETDGMNDALKELTMQINEAARGENDDLVNRLQEMGIAMSDIQNLSPDEQFIRLADGMAKLTDQSRKVLIANDLLGEESTKLISILDQGSDAVRRYAQEADSLGGIISDETAQDFVNFNKSLDKTTTALSGVATKAVANYADEMESIASAVASFVQDGEKVQDILDGVGTAALAASTIIAGRLVAAFSAWAVAQAGAVAATAAASAGLTSLAGLSVTAAARLVAVTAATRGLSVAMGVLGGPVGVIAALATTIGLWVYNSRNAETQTESLRKEMEKFKTTVSGFSDEQLADNLEKDSARMKVLIKDINSLSDYIKTLQKQFAQTGNLDYLEEANRKLKQLKELRDELGTTAVQLDVEVKADAQRSAKKAVSEISSTFDETQIQLDVNDLLDVAGNIDFSDNLTGIKKINADMEKALKKVDEQYSQIPAISMTYKEAEAKVLEKYNEKIAGLIEKGADVSAAEKARDNEIQGLQKHYANREKIIKAKTDIETKIRKDAAEKIDKIEADAAEKREKVLESIVSATRSAQLEVADASEKINMSEQDALDALKPILKEYPEYEEQIQELRTAIKAKYQKQREDLNKQELADEEATQARYQAILDSARRAIASSEELIVMDRKKALDELKELGLDEEKQRIAEIAINKQYDKEESDLAKQRAEEAARRAKEIADKRKAFFNIGVDEGDLTALEQLNADEKAALEELDATYDSEIETLEEYYAQRQAIIDRYSKEKTDVKDKNTQSIRDTASGSDSDSVDSKIAETFKMEQEAQEQLKELYDESNATYEEFEAARNAIAQQYADERQEIYSSAMDMMLSSASSGFGAISDALASAGEESSTAYKAMFALSKGFAIAQAGLNLTLAISNALASTPWPANIAAMAQVAASGAALVSQISGTSYTGRQNGGAVSPGNMYKVNENGTPEIYSYGNSDYIMGSQNAKITPMNKYNNEGSGNKMNVAVNNNGTNTSVSTQPGLTENDVVLMIKDTVPTEINNVNSKTSRAMKKSTNSGRRLR